ncbi:MAG TPA: hypothetical protein VEC60_00220 [Reyranella sp.]|nr:hypothetical protein [Reyranella sp.]
MASVTDICNAALSHCGTRSKIAAIDEGSAEASACSTHLALVRDATLRAFDWNFARLTAELAELTNPPARWRHKYALPTDCLRLRRLNDVPLLAVPETFFEIAADRDSSGAYVTVLLTQAAPVAAIYTARVDDPLRWDAGFVDALSYGLAARICFELTGKDDRVRTLTQLWQATLLRAGAEMANEGSGFNRLYLPEALQARGYVPEAA